jgi:membrane-associated protease RseP (regulator of RpoE activity)
MHSLDVLYLAFFIAQLSWLAGILPLVAWMKLPLEAVDLGVGPKLGLGQWRGVNVRLGAIPTGASVRFARDGTDDNTEVLYGRPLGAQLLVILLPWMLPAVLALGLIGPSLTVSELVLGLIAPFHVTRYVEGIAGFITFLHRSPRDGMGVLLARLTAFNLLPIPPLAGGMAVHAAVRRSHPALAKALMELAKFWLVWFAWIVLAFAIVAVPLLTSPT